MSLKNNTTLLNNLLDMANALPEAVDTTNATATANDILSGKTAYVNGQQVIGNIPSKTADDLSVSGATVSVPEGYYATAATKSVATTTQATPTISVDSNGLITATSSQSAGYVSAGNKSSTQQLTTQAAKNITPSESTQTAIAANTYATGAVTVNAIPSTYVKLPDTIEAGDYPIYGITTNQKITSSSYTDLGVYIFTVKKTGTYRFKWAMMKMPGSFGISQDITGSALYKNNSQIFVNEEFDRNNMQYNTVDVTCNAGDIISVRGKYTGSVYAGYLFGVNVCIKWDNPNMFFI